MQRTKDFLTEKRLVILLFSISGVYIVIFYILPLYGLTLGFKEFTYSKGIFSDWNGFDNFFYLFSDKTVLTVFFNTIKIGVYRSLLLIIISFFVSLVLSGINNKKLFYSMLCLLLLPQFLSWVVVSGIFKGIFAQNGFINIIVKQDILFFSDNEYFGIILFTAILWRDSGLFIFLMTFALKGINLEILDAAKLDGAGRVQILFRIKFPLLKEQFATIIVFILLGFSSGCFEAIFNLYNPVLYEKFDILDTYIYRIGITTGKISIGTTLEIIKSLLNASILSFIYIWFIRSSKKWNPFNIQYGHTSKKTTYVQNVVVFFIALFYLFPFFIMIFFTFTQNSIPTTKNLSLVINPQYIRSLLVSFGTSFCGAFLSCILTIMLSYAIYIVYHQTKVKKRKPVQLVSGFLLFLLLINGGAISLYILVRYLHLRNSYCSLFIPYLINIIFVFYFLEELKRMDTIFTDMLKNDGAPAYRSLLHIIFGLKKQGVINLFILYFISHWNNWYAGVLFIDNWNMIPVNIFLRNIIAFDINYNNIGMTASYYNLHEKMTFIFFSILPLIICFIFAQYINITIKLKKRRKL